MQQDHSNYAWVKKQDNTFNSVNRKAIVLNISIIRPLITFFSNFYYGTSHIICCLESGNKIKGRYNTRDPTAMGAYALGVTPLIHFLSGFIFINEYRSKEVAFAEDFTVSGRTSEIKAYWDILQQQELLFGYFSKLSKSYLIVKEQYYNKAVDAFMGNKVKVTSEGKRHLGAVIGSEAFKVSHAKSHVDDWI